MKKIFVTFIFCSIQYNLFGFDDYDAKSEIGNGAISTYDSLLSDLEILQETQNKFMLNPDCYNHLKTKILSEHMKIKQKIQEAYLQNETTINQKDHLDKQLHNLLQNMSKH